MALFSTLTENWSPTVDVTTKWENWGGSNVYFTGDQLNLTTAGGVANYYGINTRVNYDLTGNQVSLKLITLPTGAVGSFSAGLISLEVDTDNRYLFEFSTDKLKAFKVSVGSYSLIAEVAYNSAVHQYIRVREASGTVYYDYSTTGYSWTNLASVVTTGVAVTSLRLNISTGTWDVDNPTAKVTIVDDVNILPVAPVATKASTLLMMGV